MTNKGLEKLVEETLNTFTPCQDKASLGGYRVRVLPFNSIDKYRFIKQFDLILDIREDFWKRKGVVKVFRMWADTFFIAYYPRDERLAYPILVVVEGLAKNDKGEEVYYPKGYLTLDTDNSRILITNGQQASFIVETLIKAGWEVKLHFI